MIRFQLNLANSYGEGSEWHQGNFDGSSNGTQFNDFLLVSNYFGSELNFRIDDVSTQVEISPSQLGNGTSTSTDGGYRQTIAAHGVSFAISQRGALVRIVTEDNQTRISEVAANIRQMVQAYGEVFALDEFNSVQEISKIDISIQICVTGHKC